MAKEQKALWNSALGIWQDCNGKAVVSIESELEDGEPLFIFGYGSLLWRPGDVLGAFESWEAKCLSHGRLFGQYSMDHRGTTRFPGLVCTLYPILEGKPDSSGAYGRVWLIPPSQAAHVLAILDEREKGGYSRTVIQVRLQDYRECRAVVYIGMCGNPNFYDGSIDRLEDSSPVAIWRTANIISVAEGPSGRNLDYLLSLYHHLNVFKASNKHFDVADPYLHELTQAVCQRLFSHADCWARHAFRWNCLYPGGFDALIGDAQMEPALQSQEVLKLLGWGSNEFAQIGTTGAGPGVYCLEASTCADFMSLSNVKSLEDYHLFAGGGSSAMLCKRSGELQIVGQLCLCSTAAPDAIATSQRRIVGVVAAALGHEHALVLRVDGKLISICRDYDNAGCVPPVDYSMVDKRVPPPSFVAQMSLSEAEKLTLQADIESTDCITTLASCRIVQAAAGMRHSACVTADGVGYSWGDRRWGQAPPTGHWQVEQVRFIRVSCGSRHTVFVTSDGEVFTAGATKHGALGRPRAYSGDDGLQRVPLDPTVRWTDVRSGWAHCIARGVGMDGNLRFVGWGRCDLGQWAFIERPLDGALDTAGNALTPLPVAPPPGHRGSWLEIWCGAEHTLACDAEGGLWWTGWSPHGKPGQDVVQSEGSEQAADEAGSTSKTQDDAMTCKGHWRPVCGAGNKQVFICVKHGIPRIGDVACGGAHSLCLGSFNAA